MTADPTRHPRVAILYEDNRGTAVGFALHDLVLATVEDLLSERGRTLPRHVLHKRIVAIPKNSDTKVLAAIRNDAERIHGGRTAIVAWLDDDWIHRPLQLSAHDSTGTKIAAVRATAPPGFSQRPGVLEVFLLNGNVEAFLRRIDAARPGGLPPQTFAEAIDKDLSARDLCFVRSREPRIATGGRRSVATTAASTV
jgi:hypothetical protein